MQYYIIWIEGLTPKTGEKLKAFDESCREYTVYMTEAMRVREDDREPLMKELKRLGMNISLDDFIPTSYVPSGTLWKNPLRPSMGKVKRFEPKSITDSHIEAVTIRSKVTSRGGGVEIDVSALGFHIPDVKMTAYQNYLGGGMLGKVSGDCNLKNWKRFSELIELQNKLRSYYHRLTNPDSEWESSTFDQNQSRPVSAY